MKIYNGTNSQISLPYVGNQRINISDHSVSGDLGANISLLSTLVGAYDTNEIAIIATGPYELSMCASIPTVTNYVVQSLDEAIERLEPKKEVKKEPEPEPVKEEMVCENEVEHDNLESNKEEDYPCCCGDECKCEENNEPEEPKNFAKKDKFHTHTFTAPKPKKK